MMHLARRLKTLFAVSMSVALLAVALPATAQEVPPDQLALARKYVDLTDQSSIYEVTMVETGIETMRLIVQQNPEIIDATNTAIGKVLEEYKGRKGELLDQFARIYATRFTTEELQQIVNFYESPVGAKLSKTNAEANQDIKRVLSIFTANIKREFFAKVRADLRASGVKL